MPRELYDRLLMKTYYVVVEDVSFNARAVNLLFRNPLVLPRTTLRALLIPIMCARNREEIDFAEGGYDQCQC